MTQINCNTRQQTYDNLHLQTTLTSLESIMIHLLETNKIVEQKSSAEMPYSQ